jgi:hypothetical protein
MNKVFLVFIVFYFLIAIVLLATEKPSTNVVTILSIPQSYSRLLEGDDENLGIFLYFSSPETFFVSTKAIRSARIFDENGELSVCVDSVVPLTDLVEYEGNKYYPYRFEFAFPEIDAPNLTLIFRNATAEIIYENEEILSFELGNLDLLFKDLSEVHHLGFFRLYAIINLIGNQSSLAGIVLGLEKYVSDDLVVTGVSIATANARLRWDSALEIQEAYERETAVSTILGIESYDFFSKDVIESGKSMTLTDDQLWFIPINYPTQLAYLYRFPIIVSYLYHGDPYQYFIDDFLFFTPDTLPEVLINAICKTQYRY